jgi:N,N-dimethylformamidase
MSFKFITSDDQGNIYAVTGGGDMLYFRDEARDGTPRWANGGVGQKIGGEWGHFLHVFAGGDGIIYAVAPNGNLLYFRDEARNGTPRWANGGIGQRIGSGWNSFSKIFSGGGGVIYAVAPNGDLFYYKDEARSGAVQWAFDGLGRKIHEGWDEFAHVLSGFGGVIYAITRAGRLVYFKDKARDGTPRWAHKGKGKKLAEGWELYTTAFSGGDGVIYTATPDGFLFFYKDATRNGKGKWASRSQGQLIGSGWFLSPKAVGNIEGYCMPLSASAGDAVEFKVSSSFSYQVTYTRLKQQSDGRVGLPAAEPFNMNAHAQVAPPGAGENGCGWQTSFTLQIPAAWQSGLYAARCADLNGDETYIVFVVKPAASKRGDFAVLANTNTWNAYNGYGGASKYNNPPAALLSFERPNPETSPLDDGRINHLTRSELWILNWLENTGYKADVYSDHDFHLGVAGMADYKALILTTHPEYWTLQMVDNLENYLSQGGSLIYLGGNGIFEKVDFSSGAGALILLGGDPNGHRPGSFMRNLTPPRSERAILGVAFRFDNFMTFAPYRIEKSDHRFFAGTGLVDGDLIGESGINGGPASGWEMDTSQPGNAPAGHAVSATGADDRGKAPNNLEVLARGTNQGNEGDYGAETTCYETGGGFVFSVGSLSFGGSLVLDPRLQAIIKNVLDECLSH